MLTKYHRTIRQATGLFLAVFLLSQAPVEPGGEGLLDLDNLYNYENQKIPAYITKDNTPPDNPITNEGATLGRVLFYDQQMSLDRTISCGSCHQQKFAFSDPDHLSTGVAGQTNRRSMRLINVRFGDEKRFFWDERAPSLEALMTMPVKDHIEMGFSAQNGNPGLDSLIRRLENIDYYQTLFEFAFGDSEVTEQRIQRALAQFLRSIQSFDSRYDEGRRQVLSDNEDFPNFSEQENIGRHLFMTPAVFDQQGRRTSGGAGCAACHRPPEFDIDPESGNNGTISMFGDETAEDLTVTRAPSLRDVCTEYGRPYGGFMHNSSLGEAVVVYDVTRHYNEDIPESINPALDFRLLPNGRPQQLLLTVPERKALGIFFRTLKGQDVYQNPKWSDPFDEGGQLTLRLTTTSSTLSQNWPTGELHAYPNPVSDRLYLDSERILHRAEILDLHGRPLFAEVLGPNQSLSVSGLPAGVYLLRALDMEGDPLRSMKFVKK